MQPCLPVDRFPQTPGSNLKVGMTSRASSSRLLACRIASQSLGQCSNAQYLLLVPNGIKESFHQLLLGLSGWNTTVFVQQVVPFQHEDIHDLPPCIQIHFPDLLATLSIIRNLVEDVIDGHIIWSFCLEESMDLETECFKDTSTELSHRPCLHLAHFQSSCNSHQQHKAFDIVCIWYG